jgi:hypothetical protein
MNEQSEYAQAMRRLRTYARKLRDGEQAADRDSLERAADLALIYADKRWVKDLEAEGKAPKNKVYRGRPVDPESYNRFAGWVLTHEGLSTRHTARLLKAHDWQANYPTSGRVILTEGAIRPLYALERRGRGDQTPEVVARAQKLAGDGNPVTAAHTKQALAEFWSRYSPGEKRRMTRDAEAKRHAARIRAEARWLIEHGYLKTFADLLTELDREGEKAAAATPKPTRLKAVR